MIIVHFLSDSRLRINHYLFHGRESAGCTEISRLTCQPCSTPNAGLSGSGRPGHSPAVNYSQTFSSMELQGTHVAIPSCTYLLRSLYSPVNWSLWILNTAFKGGDRPWRQIQNCIPLSYSTFTIFSVLPLSFSAPPTLAAGRCQWETFLLVDYPALCALLLSMLDGSLPVNNFLLLHSVRMNTL